MLWFWVIVLVALIGAIAVVAAGRGDSMVEPYDDRPDVSLPSERPLTADDLRAVRLNTGVRGYRMDEVDALLGRLEAEMLDREDRNVIPLTPERAGDEPATTVLIAEEPPAESVAPRGTQTDEGAEPEGPRPAEVEPDHSDGKRDDA